MGHLHLRRPLGVELWKVQKLYQVMFLASKNFDLGRVKLLVWLQAVRMFRESCRRAVENSYAFNMSFMRKNLMR